ncbi:MAG: tRNA pseudouridine(55) synthase TruB [Alphaproteobacteria bacterium]|nr:tRNA pseudouridine(55) synthase TruB [Alphaproteobacteria bacterium]
MKSGWVILDKPGGITSRTAGGRVARMFGIKKFGHLGTLDPMASGVLPIALGEATKMIPYVEKFWNGKNISMEKSYLFGVQWGFETDTGDITGTVIKKNEKPFPCHSEIKKTFGKLIGEIEQIPPAYSAVHVNGRRAYELARLGRSVNIPARKIKIDSLHLVEPGKAEKRGQRDVFYVNCSTGTYVRSLARDMGILAGGYLATVDMIRRTRTHCFWLENIPQPENSAVPLDFLENLYNNDPAGVRKYLYPVDFGLDDILVAELKDDDAALFTNGGVIITKDDSVGFRRVYSGGRFIGIGMNDKYAMMPKRIVNY